MKRVLLVMLGIVLLLLIAFMGGWFWLNYTIKTQLVASLTESLKADVHFTNIGLNLFTGRIEATNGTLRSNDDHAIWTNAGVDRLSGSFALKDIFAAVTPVQVEITGVRISVLSPKGMADAAMTTPSTPSNLPAPAKSWPNINMEKITVHDLALSSDADDFLAAKGIEVSAEHHTTDSWDGDIKGALTVRGVSFGSVGMQFSTDSHGLSISQFSVNESGTSQFPTGGNVSGHASVPRDQPNAAEIHFDLHQMPLAMLIPVKWQVILSGQATGTGDYKGPILDWGRGTAKAHVDLQQAKLQSLPLLQNLALVPGLGNLASLSLDLAKADFDYFGGTFQFSNVELTKTGSLSFLGNLSVTSDKIDGSLRLGLAASAVALIPPLKKEIFNVDEGVYSWTDIKVSGSPDKIEEDLSPRLIALTKEQAAQLLNQGQGAVSDGLKKASDFLNSLSK